MKKLCSLFSLLVLSLALCSVSEARGIQEHGKLALNGVQTPALNQASPTLISTNGQAITGISISTGPTWGQFTALFDTNLVYEDPPSSCFFDVYTPPLTTQFFDFTGLGTTLNGSTGGIALVTPYPQVKPTSGISIATWHTDASTTQGAAVMIYVDASAD